MLDGYIFDAKMTNWDYNTSIKYKKSLMIMFIGGLLISIISFLLVCTSILVRAAKKKEMMGQFSLVVQEEL